MNTFYNLCIWFSIKIVFSYPTEIGTKWNYQDFVDSIMADTTINEIVYQVVNREPPIGSINQFLIRANQNRVYVLDSIINSTNFERIVFDFSLLPTPTYIMLEVADYITFYDFGSFYCPCQIIDIDSSTIGIHTLNGHEIEWAKNFGIKQDVFNCLAVGTCPVYSNILLSVTLNNDTLYKRTEPMITPIFHPPESKFIGAHLLTPSIGYINLLGQKSNTAIFQSTNGLYIQRIMYPNSTYQNEKHIKYK